MFSWPRRRRHLTLGFLIGGLLIACALLLRTTYVRSPTTFIPTESVPHAVAFSPDGSLLAVEHGQSRGFSYIDAFGDMASTDAGQATALQRVADGMVQQTLPVSATRGLAFDPTGARLAALSATGEVSVWTVTDGRAVANFRHRLSYGRGQIAFTPDGRYLSIYTGTRRGTETTLYDWQRGIVVQSYPGCVAFSPNGVYVAVSDGERTQVRRLADDAFVRTVDIGGCPSFIPGSAQLFGMSSNNQQETLLVDAASGAVVRTFEGMRLWRTAAFDPHGGRVALGEVISGGGWFLDLGKSLRTAHRVIRVWDLTTGRLVERLAGADIGTEVLAWSPDGRWLAAVDPGSNSETPPGVRLRDRSQRGRFNWW